MGIDLGTELQWFEIENLEGGLIADLPVQNVPPVAVYDSLNVDFERRMAFKRGGYGAAWITGLTDPVCWIDEFIDATNKRWLIIVTTKRVYTYDIAGTTLTDRTPAAGTPLLTGTITDPVSGCEFFNKYYVTNNRDKPMYWDGSAADFVYLTGTGAPERALCVAPFGSHLLWGNIKDTVDGEKYARVIWSDFQNGLVYDPTAGTLEAGENDLEDTDDHVIGFERLGNILLVGRRKSFFECQFVGAPWFYKFSPAVKIYGLLATRTLKETPLGAIGLTNANVILYTGSREQLIGTEKITSYLSQLLLLNVNGAFAIFDDNEQKWKLFVSHRTDGIPDTMYSLSTQYATFSRHKFNNLITAVGKYTFATYPKWSDFPNGWGTYFNRWGDPLTGGISGQLAYGDYGGNIYNKTADFSDAGVAIPAYFKTGASELNYPGGKELAIIQFYLKKQVTGSINVYIHYSLDGENFLTYGPLPCDMTGTQFARVFAGVYGKFFSIGVEQNVLNEGFEIRKMRLGYMPMGLDI
jgi:hypothetical protein